MKSIRQLFYLTKEEKEEIEKAEREQELRKQLLSAAEKGNLNAVMSLINQGADKETIGVWRSTPLILAAKQGHEVIVEYLVKAGADKEAKDNEGKSALIYAAKRGHQEIVEYLVEAGAEIEVKDLCGFTPLIFAAVKCHKNIVSYLVKAGAEIEAKDNYGHTSLMIAAMMGSENMVSYLADLGADKEAKDNEGKTPLMLAAMWGRENIVSSLKILGVDKEAKDNKGKTPLMLAASSGKKDIVQYLVEDGADKEAKDKNGNTALDLARLCGCKKTSGYLELVLNDKQKNSPLPIEETNLDKTADAEQKDQLPEYKELVEKNPELDYMTIQILKGNFDNLNNLGNIATRDELSAVGGIDADLIAWYQASYSFIQESPELNCYCEALAGTLVASFGSLQMQDSGVTYLDQNDAILSEAMLGKLLTTIAQEVPLVKSAAAIVTGIAFTARSYLQQQYAKNIWSHIGKERNIPLYASMLACGMTLMFKDSLNSNTPDKENELSDKVIKYCQSIFDEFKGKSAQSSSLSNFADTVQSKDGVSDALGLVRIMMCAPVEGEAQKSRLSKLFEFAREVRSSRKNDSITYIADPFDMSLVSTSPDKGAPTVNLLIADSEESALEISPSEADYVPASAFNSTKSDLERRVAALEADKPDKEVLLNLKMLSHTNTIVQTAEGGTSAASSSSSATTDAKVSMLERENQELRAQLELITRRLASVEESQDRKSHSVPEGKREEEQHDKDLQKLFAKSK